MDVGWRGAIAAALAAALLAGCLLPPGEPGITHHAPPPLDRLWADNPIQVTNHSDAHRTYRLSLDLADTTSPYINRVTIIADGDARVDWNWTIRFPGTGANSEVSVLALHAGLLGIPEQDRATGAIHATADGTWNLLVVGGGIQGTYLFPEDTIRTQEANGTWHLAMGEEVIIDYGALRHWLGHARTHDVHVELEVHGPSHAIVAAHHTDRPWVEAGWGLFAQPFGPAVQVSAGPATVTAVERLGFEGAVPQASLIYAAGSDPDAAQSIAVRFHDEEHDNPDFLVRTASTPGPARIDVRFATETGTGPFWLVANTYWPFLETWTSIDDRVAGPKTHPDTLVTRGASP